jgi:hypothetical protein
MRGQSVSAHGGVGGGTDNHAVNLGVRFSW